MSVPLLPVTSDRDRELSAGRIYFDGLIPRMDGAPVPYSIAASSLSISTEEKLPLITMDVKGLQRRNMNDVLLKKLKVRGRKIWFLTQVESVDDVLDGFNTDADSLIFPLHTVRSMSELKDMEAVSDSLIPAIFVSKGKVRNFGGEVDCIKAEEFLRGEGFYGMVLIDTDGSVTDDEWKELSSTGVLPYSVHYSEDELMEFGFENAISHYP